MTGHILTVCTSYLQTLVVYSGRDYLLSTHISVANMDTHSTAFNDFGPKFTCVDPRGESPLTGMIVSVDKVLSNYP